LADNLQRILFSIMVLMGILHSIQFSILCPWFKYSC